MRSAENTPTVKRFLFLGSVGSAVMTAKDPTKEIITRDDWNIMTQEAVKNLEDPFIGFHILYFYDRKVGHRSQAAEIVVRRPMSLGHTAYRRCVTK